MSLDFANSSIEQTGKVLLVLSIVALVGSPVSIFNFYVTSSISPDATYLGLIEIEMFSQVMIYMRKSAVVLRDLNVDFTTFKHFETRKGSVVVRLSSELFIPNSDIPHSPTIACIYAQRA